MVLTPDLLDKGGDPYKAMDSDGEVMYGTIFTEPVKKMVHSNSTATFNVTQAPDSGIYSITLYPDIDWNNPYKVLYYYLYYAEWNVVISPKN